VRRPGLLACRMVRQHRLALRNSETQTLAAASAWLHCQQIPGLCKLEALTVQKHNQRHNLAAGSSRVEHRQGVIATSAAPTWKPLNSRFHKLGSSMPTNRSGLPAASRDTSCIGVPDRRSDSCSVASDSGCCGQLRATTQQVHGSQDSAFVMPAMLALTRCVHSTRWFVTGSKNVTCAPVL